MARKAGINAYSPNPHKKRPGVHSKKRTSNHKHATNYKKKYIGQGR